MLPSSFKLESLDRSATQTLAQNPRTSPVLLTHLAQSTDPLIRKTVTANPNTPTPVLMKLGCEFPAQLLENQIFPLLLIENPNLLETMPVMTLASLVNCEKAPVSFLMLAVKRHHPTILMALANNLATPLGILNPLTKSQHQSVRESALLHVTVAGEMMAGWEEAAWDQILTTDFYGNNQDSVTVFSQEGIVSQSIILKLAKHQIPYIRALVACHPHTPETIRKQITEAKPSFIAGHNTAQSYQNIQKIFRATLNPRPLNITPCLLRFILLLHPKIPPRTLAANCRSRVWLERYAIATNSNSPNPVLLLLSRDANRIVRATAKANLATRFLTKS